MSESAEIRPKPEEGNLSEENSRWQRRHSRRGSPGIFAGLVLLVLGVLFLLANQGIIGWDVWWQYFLVGLGAAFLIDGGVRYLRGERESLLGSLIPGLVLIGIGLVFLAGAFAWWPLVIIAAGVIILLSGLLRHRP